jgi:FkbM family methyltransferase
MMSKLISVARLKAWASLKHTAVPLLGAVGLLSFVNNARNRLARRRKLRDIAGLYRHFISPGDLCFDVGANVGEMSQIMLNLGARVIAVEPQDENIHELRARLSANPDLVVVPKAMASRIGSADLLVCEFSDCSSMSPEFVAAVQRSGRLPSDVYKWNEVRQVPTTTLDELIREYGVPRFVKIDVEGFEDEVIRGCSQKLNALSFEFTPERLQPALTCIGALEHLGSVEFNYCLRRKTTLELSKWVSGEEVTNQLKNMSYVVYTGPGGDLYARFI